VRASNANDRSASISCACALACTRVLTSSAATPRDVRKIAAINQVTGISPFHDAAFAISDDTRREMIRPKIITDTLPSHRIGKLRAAIKSSR